MAGALIGALRVTLGLDSAEFTAGSKKAQAEATALQTRMKSIGAGITSMAGGLAAGFAIVGVSNLVADTFAMASALKEASDAAGVTVVQLQRLRLAAEQNGGTAEQMDASLAKLSARLGEAKTGSASAVAAFGALGISMKDVEGMNAGDAFALIAEKISKIKDPTLQAALAKDIFGKSYAQLLPLLKGGTQALDEATAASKRNGEMTDEEAKKLDRFADGWDEFKKRLMMITVDVMSEIMEIGEWVTKLGTSFVDMAETVNTALNDFRQRVIDGFNAVVAQVRTFVTNLPGLVKQMVMNLGYWINDKLVAIFDRAIAKIKEVVGWFDWMDNEVVRNSYVPDMVIAVNAWFGKMEKGMTGPTERATKSVAEKMQEMRDNVAGILDSLFPEAAAIRDLESKISTLTAAFKAGEISVGVYRAGLSKLEAELKDVKDAAAAAALPPLPTSYGNDNDEPLGDVSRELENLRKKTPGITVSVKRNFEDLARAIQNNAAAIANSISDMTSSFGGLIQSFKKGDIAGIIGGIANTIGSVLDTIGKFRGGGGIPAYANGTNFHPGGLAMVGERGRELVQLPRGSKVFPNGKGPAGMGGEVRVLVGAGELFTATIESVSGGVVARAAPMIAQGGAALAQRRAATLQGRRLR